LIAEYLGLVMMLGAAIALLGGLFFVQWVVAVRSAARASSTAESGAPDAAARHPESEASPRGRHAVKFYLVALLFGTLNVASLFFFAWGAAFRDLGWDGLATAGIFALPLVVAVVYQWRNGVFEW
jgi:NADH:ubiquinone oxidoreductase subunit 3 (subunit A)